MMNQSPRVQGQLQLAQEIQNRGRVQSQLALAAEINSRPNHDSRHPDNQPPLQRKLKEYQDKTKSTDMEELAGVLDGCVDAAKAIVDSNPMLTGVPKRTTGYLGTWVTCFEQFVSSGDIPDFFYARYGYAIETLATAAFLAEDHKGYKVNAQVTQGSTRPDLVISSGSDHIAWLDITSSASVGHILAKQGGGWKTRPYVAEILYEMPSPANFATSAKGKLTKEQQEKLKKADEARALRELQFDKGMKAMGLLLGNAYQKARDEKGEGLSKADVRDVTISVCKDKLNGLVDKGITPGLAAGVLAVIDSVEVTGQVDPGLSWAKWAFKNTTIRWSDGRALLWDYGKSL